MEHLDSILRITENELGAIVTNGKYRSREEIHSVYELMDIAKDIHKIWCMEDEIDGESYDGGPHVDGMRHSYARGRKRDSMGRYSREYRDGYRGYSRDGKEEYKEHLRELMEDAPDEQTRQSIQRMIEQMGR